ncbi:MAG: thiamine pyrophosphate-binding protein [Bacillota bacterium]
MDPWKVIVEMLKAQGIEYVFGLGDTFINMYADETAGIEAINLRHESSTPFMAMAYSRLSGNIGVCSGAPGPGVANLIPGVLEAYSGSIPLVIPCLSASRKTKGRGEFQEVDQVKMLEPVTKWAAQVPAAERIPWYLKEAFKIAQTGRPGPVYLDIPADVAGDGPLSKNNHRYDIDYPKGFSKIEPFKPIASSEKIIKSKNMIIKAEKPVIIAGNGAILSRAFNEFATFIEKAKIPFLTTPGGRGIYPEDTDLALGLSGRYRSEPARKYYQMSDLVIIIGSSNEAFQTGWWEHLPDNAEIIQFDIDLTLPGRAGKDWEPDLFLPGDIKSNLKELNETFAESEINKGFSQARIKLVKDLKADYFQKVEDDLARNSDKLRAREVISKACQTFDDSTILVNENGGQDTWSYSYPYYQVKRILGNIPVAEQTCMGMGVVGAIGAKLTRPDRPVLAICGDGAFQMYLQEMATACQYNLGLTWLVLNNHGLGWIRSKQKEAGVNTDTTNFKSQPDLTKVAQAYGCYSKTITEREEIIPALKSAISANKNNIPAVLNFEIEYWPNMEHLDDNLML